MVQRNTAEAFTIIAAPVWIHLVILLCATGVDCLDDFSGPIDPTGLVDFSSATACACPGSSVQYYCTVNDPTGTSTTRWRGSAFICTGNDASLFHSDYMSGSAADPCTDGGFNLIARGLTNITDNCYTSVLSVIIVPGLSGRTVECTSVGIRIIGNDTLEVSVPLPPPSSPVVEQVIPDQSFIVSWTPPPNDCGNAVSYSYLTSPDDTCGQCTSMNNSPSVTCTGWTAQGQSCSIVARADTENCGGQQGEESEPVIVTLEAPQAPVLIGGMAITSDSMHSLKIIVSWNAVNSTADIAVSGGQVLLDGSITEYLVSLVSEKDVTIPCSSPTCSVSVSAEFPANRSGFSISVAAVNALVRGPSAQAHCELIHDTNVNVTIGSTSLNVTLTCPIEPCTISYGLDPSYQDLPFEGLSGQPLQNLSTQKTYYYEASVACGIFTVRLQDSFDTCACGKTAGPLPVAISVVMTFALTLLIGLLGMLLVYCIMNRRLQQSSSHTEPATAAAPPPVYDVVGPGEKFEMEGNTAYRPVRR